VQRVARQYLTTENRTLYALLPNGAAPKTTTATEKTSEHAIQKFVLPNGVRLLV
jgi:predicted Zn-dependent peptidase